MPLIELLWMIERERSDIRRTRMQTFALDMYGIDTVKHIRNKYDSLICDFRFRRRDLINIAKAVREKHGSDVRLAS